MLPDKVPATAKNGSPILTSASKTPPVAVSDERVTISARRGRGPPLVQRRPRSGARPGTNTYGSPCKIEIIGDFIKGVSNNEFCDDVKFFSKKFLKSHLEMNDKLQYYYGPYQNQIPHMSKNCYDKECKYLVCESKR